MFVEVKKNPLIYVQQKAMGSQLVAPVTSSFRINLGLVAEFSTYSIKEIKKKQLLDGTNLDIPVGSRVIHMEMSYTHSTHVEAKGTSKEHTFNERYFYKLVFFPGAEDEFLRIRNIFDRQTLS